MNYYGKHPQEQAVQTLIHDINNSTGNANYQIKNLDEWLQKKGKQMTEAGIDDTGLFLIAEYLRTSQKKVRAALDAYLVEFKKFPTPEV